MAAAIARWSCTLFLFFAPLALAQHQEFDTRLVEYPDTGCTSSCTPLILIHGIHGTGVDSGCEIGAPPRALDGTPADCNWWPLIDYLKRNDTATWQKIKIYIFRYISDNEGHDAGIIGRELRKKIEEEEQIPRNAQLLIVAHSMGGIVARNFMNYTPPESSVRGYDMTMALVTLATPHHGSPLANLHWRNWKADSRPLLPPNWDQLACLVCAPSPRLRPSRTLDFLDSIYWGKVNKRPDIATQALLPNRSDLLWDDYDNLFQEARNEVKDEPIENNLMLAANHSTTDALKVIAYAGYIDRRNRDTDVTNAFFNYVGDVLFDYIKGRFKSWGDLTPAKNAEQNHRFLEAFGGMMLFLKKNDNDGMVPVDSAHFDQNPYVAARRTFLDYDHQDMLGNKPGIDAREGQNNDLFSQLDKDVSDVLSYQGPPPRLLGLSLQPSVVTSGTVAKLAYKIQNSQQRIMQVALIATISGFGDQPLCSVKLVDLPKGPLAPEAPIVTVYRDLAIPASTMDTAISIDGELRPPDDLNSCMAVTQPLRVPWLTEKPWLTTKGNMLAGQVAIKPPTIALRLADSPKQDYLIGETVQIVMTTTAGTGNSRVFITLRSDGPNGQRYYRYNNQGQLQETNDPTPVAPASPALDYSENLPPIVVTSSLMPGTYIWRAAMYNSEIISPANLLAESPLLTYTAVGNRMATPSVTALSTPKAIYKTGDTMTILYTTSKGSSTVPYDLMLKITSECSGSDYYFYDNNNDTNRWIHTSPQPMWTGAVGDGDFQIPDGSMPPILIDDDTPSGTFHMMAYFSEMGKNTPVGKTAETNFELQTAKNGCICFIATAAYGSPMASSVVLLRKFRDHFLVTQPWGRALVDAYYLFAPPVAQAIQPHPIARKIVRAFLWPVIAFSALSLRLSVWAATLLIASLLAAFVWWMRRASGKVRLVVLVALLAAAAGAAEIRGTVVRARPFPVPVPGVQFTVDQTGITGVSAEDGGFRLTGVSAGAHKVNASAPGYLSASIDVQVPSSSSVVPIVVALVPSAARTYEYYLPHTAEGEGWWTFFSLLNPSDVGSDVTVAAYDANGRFLDTSSKIVRLGINQQVSGTPSSFFPGTVIAKAAWYKVTSTAPLSGFEMFGSTSGTIAGFPLTLADSNVMYLPHIAVDSQWWTGISLVAAGVQTAEVHLQARNGVGVVLTEAGHPTLLGPGEKTVGLIESYFGIDFPLDIQWASVTANGPITGFALFGTKDFKMMAAVPALSKGAKRSWLPHLATNDGWWTGIVLLNVDSLGGTVRLTAYDQNGVAVALSRDIELGPGERTVGVAESYFGSLPASAKYLEANSTADITGFELVGQFSPPLCGGLASITTPSKDIAFAYAVATKDWNATLNLANTGSLPARVALTAMDSNGKQLVSKTVTIAAHAYYTGSMVGTFGFVPASTAWVKASSDGALLVGFLQLFRPANGQFTDIPADPVRASARSTAKASLNAGSQDLANMAALLRTQAVAGGGVRVDWPAWLDGQVAELSGGRIRRGDTILAIQGQKVNGRQDLIRLAPKARRASAVDVQVRSPQGLVQVVRIAVPRIAGGALQ